MRDKTDFEVMMRLAIQEIMLPGDSAAERLEHAKMLCVDGVEFPAGGIGARIMEVAKALDATGLGASALNIGGTHLLHPDFETRDAAIVAIRQAMADSLDLETGAVIFRSHRPDTPRLPDLRPFKHPLQLEGEFLAKQLRTTLADLAYAMGATLHLEAANRYETHLLNRVEQAAAILKRNDNHPHVKLAVNTFHMALEEDDLYAALQTHAKQTGSVHLADHNGRLPGQGWIDFGRVIAALREGGYDGWLTIATPSSDLTEQQQRAYLRDLPQSIGMLRDLL